LEPSKCTFFIPHSFTLYLNFTLYLLYCTVQRYSSYCPAFSWKVVALDFEEISFDLKFRSCERIKKKKKKNTVQRYSSYCTAFSWKVAALDFEEMSCDLKFQSCDGRKKWTRAPGWPRHPRRID
jgi:hypothetical protein